MTSLQLHRSVAGDLLKHPSHSRSQYFSIRGSFIHQRGVTACFPVTEGGNLQEWNDNRMIKRHCSRKRWWNMAHMFWNHVVSSFNIRNNKLEALKEGSKLDEQPMTRFIQVVAGLLGTAFLLSKLGGVNLLSFWLMATFKRGQLQRTPLHVGQFAAVTSALNNSASITMPSLEFINEGVPRLSYILDTLLEQHPITYILLLMSVCIILIFIGGFLFSKFRTFKQKSGDSFWDAWACVCSSGTHLKEKTALERSIGLMLAVGGLLFYSLLTSTMTAHFKTRMELLREGVHSQVMEKGHVVICGTNNHLITVLKQLNKSQKLALHDGRTKKLQQTVLLLSESEREVTEKLVSNELRNLLQLNILTRSGSLSNTASFEKVAAGRADSIIILAPNKNKYESDAESVLTVLALQPLLESSAGKLVVEVFSLGTSELLRSSTGLKLNAVQNLSSKMLVQCSRQPGLVDVYRELLDHDRQIINIRTFPTLAGISYQELRRGFPEAVVCGLLQDGKINFHPPDKSILKESDKVLMICTKNSYKNAPKNLIASKVGGELCIKVASEETALIPAHTSLLQRDTKQACKAADWQVGPRERILLLGWHPRVSEMITEYDDYVGPGTELIILAETSKEEREYILSRKIRKPLQNVQVNHQVGNPMSRTDIRSAILHPLPRLRSRCSVRKNQAPDSTHMPLSILAIADNIWTVGDKASGPDKQAVLALLLAEDVCKKLTLEVNSLVAEFVDAELAKQVMKLRPNLKAIGTDEIVGLITAQVAEQSELGDVWTDLLNSWGDEIYAKGIERYVKAGENTTFAALTERAVLHNEIAIGYTMGGKTVINPPSKDAPLSFSENDALVVISEFQYI